MKLTNTIKIIGCVCIIVLSILSGTSHTEGFGSMNTDANIIGYIHVCQKGEWRKSYDLLMSSIKDSGLYENIKEIRLGVVSENSKLIEDDRFNDTKVRVVCTGKVEEYERPTLLHMKKSSNEDPGDTLYFYLHTKGIRWWGTKHETKVVEWIRSMLDCNITNWENAVKILETSETYGCNYNGGHYSGNFWWATAKHIRKLSDIIPEYYTAPEDWVLTNKDNMYCYQNCGDKYVSPYDPEMYK